MSTPVRLAALTQPGRAIVLALLEAESAAARKRKAAPAIVTPEAAQEARRARVEPTAA